MPSSHPLRSAWWNMIRRCHEPSTRSYRWYGARGIGVCDRWRESLANFAEDMGPRPEGTTLDRIDGDGDYTPENCQWLPAGENARKRRKRTHCFAGHEFTPETTSHSADGTIRWCRICKNERERNDRRAS